MKQRARAERSKVHVYQALDITCIYFMLLEIMSIIELDMHMYM